MTIDSTDRTPPPEMTGSTARVAHMRNWVEQLEADIARLQVERDTLWKAIAVLDPDCKVTFGSQVITTSTDARPVTMNPGTTVVSPALVEGTKPPAGGPGRKQAKTPTHVGAKVAAKKAPRGLTGKYDYAKVAEAADLAIRDGLSVRDAIRALYPSITDSMAGWVVSEARRKGHTIRGGRHGRKVASKPVAATVLGKRDYPEIAKHIIEYRNDGLPVAPTLAKFYKVPEATARNWMTRCREMRLVPALTANLKVIEDNTIVDHSTAVYNAREVAVAYLEAIRTNLRPIQHVADSLGIDKPLAITWVRQARLDGELPATKIEPQLPEAERRALLEPKYDPGA